MANLGQKRCRISVTVTCARPPLSRLRSSERKCFANPSSTSLSSFNSWLRWSITSCGTSGLFGGILVDGVPFNILIIASPDLAVVFFAGAFLVVVFLVVFFLGSCHDCLLSFRLVSVHTNRL